MSERESAADSDAALEHAFRVAHRYLAYGMRSEEDVRARLTRADIPDCTSRQVIEKLNEAGQLNDEVYAMDYVQARVSHKAFGPLRIRKELRKHGIAEKYIAKALNQIAPENAMQTAKVLACRFWPRTHGSPAERARKVRDYLLRRGYSYGQAMEALASIKGH